MMKRTALLLFVATLAVACIHVVVNVYFPEAEAKGALATLEDELLRPAPKKAPEVPAETPKPQEQPAPKPQAGVFGWFRPGIAYAAGSISEEQIYNQIKSMPQVLAAYQRMASRLHRVDALRAAGLVGEGRDGLLQVRATLSDRRDQRTMEDENADRTTVIRGLAEATLTAQGQPVGEETLAKVLPDAGSTFAALRREKAQSGWWIQMPDGSWKKK